MIERAKIITEEKCKHLQRDVDELKGKIGGIAGKIIINFEIL